MNSAKELCAWALASIDGMKRPDRSYASIYREVSRLSGLSVSLVQQFHKGTKPNPSAETLDRLIEGIKVAQRLVDDDRQEVAA